MMKFFRRSLLVAASLLSLSAMAQDSASHPDPAVSHDGGGHPDPMFPKGEGPHKLALTFQPLLLIDTLDGSDRLHLIEVAAERELVKDVSITGILGLGFVRQNGRDGYLSEVGAQGRYYLVGNFNHGLDVGVHAAFLNVAFKDDDQFTDLGGSGLTVGPFVGYKYAADFGLTVDLQAGLVGIAAFGHATDRQLGTTDWGTDSAVRPLARISVGWSF